MMKVEFLFEKIYQRKIIMPEINKDEFEEYLKKQMNVYNQYGHAFC